MSSPKHFDFTADPEKYGVSKGYGSGGENIAKQTRLYETEDWGELVGDIHMFSSVLGFHPDNMPEERFLLSNYQQDQQVESFSGFESIGDLHFDIFSPPLQPCQEETSKLASNQSEDLELIEEKVPNSIPLASLGILRNFGKKLSQLKGQKINVSSYNKAVVMVSGQKLSIDAVIRLGGEKFIQSSSQRVDDQCALTHPFSSSLVGLSNEDARDVELVQLLLASAEKVSQQQFERASKLLNQCD